MPASQHNIPTINIGPDCSLALINICSEDYNDDFNGTKILFLNFPRALFKDYIYLVFQTFANKILHALFNGCIFSSSQATHGATMNLGSDCPKALINNCPGHLF